MKRLLIFVCCAALSGSLAWADGMMISFAPYEKSPSKAGSWDIHEETDQEAILTLSDDRQRMLLRVGLADAGRKGVFWILPVPAPAEHVQIDLPSYFPELRGEELFEKLHGQARAAGRRLGAAQLQAQLISTYEVLSTRLYLMLPAFGLGSLDGDGSGAASKDGSRTKAPEVVVHQEMKKEGMTAQAITARTGAALLAHLQGKGLRVREDALPTLQGYIGKDYSFVVSWINASKAPTKARSIYLSFPAGKLFYPLIPTRIYGDKIIPVTLRIIGQASPTFSERLAPFATTRYYVAERWENDVSGKGLYRDDGPPLEYTKVELRAPSTALDDDLWIVSGASLRVRAAYFLARRAKVWTAPIYAAGILAGFLAGWACFDRLRSFRGGLKLLVLAVLNAVFSPLFILAAAAWRFDGETDRLSRRKLLFIPLCGVGIALVLWPLALLLKKEGNGAALPDFDFFWPETFLYAIALWWGSFAAHYLAQAKDAEQRKRFLLGAAGTSAFPFVVLIFLNLSVDSSFLSDLFGAELALPIQIAGDGRWIIRLILAAMLGAIAWSRSGPEGVFEHGRAIRDWSSRLSASLLSKVEALLPTRWLRMVLIVGAGFGLAVVLLPTLLGLAFVAAAAGFLVCILVLPVLALSSIDLREEHAWAKAAGIGLLWGLWAALPLPFWNVGWVSAGLPSAGMLVPILGALVGLGSMALRSMPGLAGRARNMILAGGLGLLFAGFAVSLDGRIPRESWSLAALSEAIHSNDPTVAAIAESRVAQRYAKYPSDREAVVTILLGLLKDPNPQKRQIAIHISRQLKATFERRRGPAWDVSLIKPAPEALVKALTEMVLNEPDKNLRYRAWRAIMYWVESGEGKKLQRAVRRGNLDDLRSNAEAALGREQARHVAAAFAKTLESGAYARQDLARALSRLGLAEGRVPLSRASRGDPDKYVRESAGLALMVYGSPEAIPFALTRLKYCRNPQHCRDEIAFAGRLKIKAASPHLFRLLQIAKSSDVDDLDEVEARIEAVEALKSIHSREPKVLRYVDAMSKIYADLDRRARSRRAPSQ